MPRYTENEARAAAATSFSVTEVLRKLGLRAAGGNHAVLKKYLELWGVPTEHFNPNRGKAAHLGRAPFPLEDVLVEHSTYSRTNLKRRLYDTGLKSRECEMCGQGEMWHGQRMSLILDHVNGVADDHRLGNLRIVCPNCNATLETHCGRHNAAPLRRCLRCGDQFKPRGSRQKYCSSDCGQRHDRGVLRPESRKVERPDYATLLRELEESNYSAVGRRYGVSDNAIRKWVRAYEEAARRDAGSDGGMA